MTGTNRSVTTSSIESRNDESRNIGTGKPGTETEAPHRRQHGAGAFPGPLVSGISLVVSPILAIVGTGLAIGDYSESGSVFAADMARHHGLLVTGINISITGVTLGLFVVIFLAQAICTTHPRLGRAAGVLAIIGLMGPMFFEGIFWGASHVVDTTAHQNVAATLIDRSNMVPTTIDNVSGPCLLVGFILLAVGTAKSGVLSTPRSWALGVTCLIPFGFISGYIIISTIAFVGLAIAVVPLGIQVLRERSESPAHDSVHGVASGK